GGGPLRAGPDPCLHLCGVLPEVPADPEAAGTHAHPPPLVDGHDTRQLEEPDQVLGGEVAVGQSGWHRHHSFSSDSRASASRAVSRLSWRSRAMVAARTDSPGVWPCPAYCQSARTSTVSGSWSSRPKAARSWAARYSARVWRSSLSVVE